MNIQANKIDEAVKSLQSLNENDPGFWNATTIVPLAIGVSMVVLGIVYFLYSTNNQVDFRSFVIVILGIAIFCAGTVNVRGNNHRENIVQAKTQVQEAYKASVVDNFRITETEMVNLELRPRTDGSNTYSEVNFEYTDLEEMARYDLVFLFDPETNEPTLLNTGSVDSEIIEKLSK